MLNVNELAPVLQEYGDPAKAVEMQAYMRDRFEFFGIQSPLRKQLFREFFKDINKNDPFDHALVHSCYDRPEREFHYLAMDYSFKERRKLNSSDIKLVRFLVTNNSWWDTVDFIASNIAGDLALRFPELKNRELDRWTTSDNMWLRRTSIIFQLKYKQQTDTNFLETAIVRNLGSDEFFINKAIGWSLRQYSKFNPEWVRNILEEYDLQPLSRREASKYI